MEDDFEDDFEAGFDDDREGRRLCRDLFSSRSSSTRKSEDVSPKKARLSRTVFFRSFLLLSTPSRLCLASWACSLAALLPENKLGCSTTNVSSVSKSSWY